MQKISSICKKGLAMLLVATMVITLVPALDVFADVEGVNNETEQNQSIEAEVVKITEDGLEQKPSDANDINDEAEGSDDAEVGQEVLDAEGINDNLENQSDAEEPIDVEQEGISKRSLTRDADDEDHYTYDANKKVTVKGKDFYYVKVDKDDIGRTDLEIDFGENNHVMATQVGDTAYYFAPNNISDSANVDAYYYGSAGILYPDFWRNEGLSAPSAENWTASSSKVDSEGFNDMGGFDVISRATSKHGTYRAPFQFITDVYGAPVNAEGTVIGPVQRFVSEHDPLITTVEGRTSHARQPREITSVPAEVIASCKDGAKDFEVNGVTYKYDHYEIRGIQRVPVKLEGKLYVGNLVLQAAGEATISHFEDFVLDGQDGSGLVVTATTGNMKELQANGEYGPVSAGVQTSARPRVVVDAEKINVNNNHSWGDYAEAQIGIKHADGSTMGTEDMLNFVTRFTSATYEYYGADSTLTNLVARYGTMASVDTWWSTNHGNRVDAGFMFDSYRLGGDGQNKNIQLGYWKVTFRSAGYEDLVAAFEIKQEISAVEESITLANGTFVLKDNINYTGNKVIEYTSSNEGVVKISEIESIGEDGLPVVDRNGNPVMVPIAVAVGGGTATITATVNKGAKGDLEASTSFNMIVDAKTSLNQSKYTLYTAGTPKTVALKATVTGPSEEVTWASSDATIASVDANGLVTAKKAGTATITATANGIQATCVVTVIKPSTKLNKTSATIHPTGSKNKITLKATVAGPSQKVTWKSSNTKIVTVSSKGVVTAKKIGTATITATANGVKATCKITVANPTTKLNKSSATICSTGSKNKITLKATVVGASTTVAWKSSDTKIATVTSKGVVTAKKAGKVTITATANGVKATCKLTVVKPTIKLDKTAATIYTKGSKSKLTLKATISGPSKTVTWKSSDTKIATVTSKGVITAKKAGKVTITATANGISKKATITVKKSTLKLEKNTATIKKGKTVTIKATASPKATITYKTSNAKIATVTSKGVVKGVKKGTATITVTANSIKMTFTVTVK